jgi:hypothetical protein
MRDVEVTGKYEEEEKRRLFPNIAQESINKELVPTIPLAPPASVKPPVTAPAVTPTPETVPTVPAEEAPPTPQPKGPEVYTWTPVVASPEEAKKRNEKLITAAWKNVTDAEAQANEELPKHIKGLYKDELDEIRTIKNNLVTELKSGLDANLTSYEANKRKAELAEIAQTIMLASVQLAAGIHGYRTGKDYTSGLTFNPKDWSKEMSSLREELQTRNNMLKEYHREAMDVKEAEEKDVLGLRKEAAEVATESWKEKLQRLRQQAGEIEKGIVNAEYQRVEDLNKAKQFEASARNAAALEQSRRAADTEKEKLAQSREARMASSELEKARRQEITNFEATAKEQNKQLTDLTQQLAKKPSEEAVAGIGLQLTKMGATPEKVQEVIDGARQGWIWKDDGTVSAKGGILLGKLASDINNANRAAFFEGLNIRYPRTQQPEPTQQPVQQATAQASTPSQLPRQKGHAAGKTFWQDPVTKKVYDAPEGGNEITSVRKK